MRGAAVACAQGTFKEAAGNGDCTECPEGFTTQPSSVAATSRRNCSCERAGAAAASLPGQPRAPPHCCMLRAGTRSPPPKGAA